MLPEYQNLLALAKKQRKSIKKTIQRLRKMRKGKVDQLIHPLHSEAFQHIDCLACANCCKTTGPLFLNTDIDRIAKSLKMSSTAFIEQYLKIDEEDDYVLQQVPCSFLGADNYCSIYDVRPKACQEFPHTDRINQSGILSLTEKNSRICPAVADILINIEIS